MKIVFINPKFHPIVGGGETYLFDIAALLQNEGHEVTVLTAAHPLRKRHDYPFQVRHILGLSDENPAPNKAIPALYRALQQLDPDVLHVHGYMSYWLLIPFIDELKKITKILSIHSTPKLAERVFGTFSHYDAEVTFARFILEHPSIEEVYVGGKYYAACLRQIAPNAPLRVLPFFVRPEQFPFMPERAGFNILFPSRILERKGIFEAIQMLAGMPKQFRLCLPAFDKTLPDATHTAAWELIQKLNLVDRVDIPIEPVQYGGMQQYYAQALVTIMPSHYEGFGIALIESMASGTPVVASNIPGIQDVIEHGVSGLLVPAHAPDALRDAVIGLADRDDPRRQGLIKAAHRRTQQLYNPQVHMAELLRAYDGVLNGES